MENQMTGTERLGWRRSNSTQPGRTHLIRNLALLWLGLGIFVGVGSRPAGEGVVGIIAGMIAGTMVMPLIGVLLGLAGARVGLTLLGAFCGMAIALITGLSDGAEQWMARLNLGLVAGALAGATVPLFLTCLAALKSRLGASGRLRGVNSSG